MFFNGYLVLLAICMVNFVQGQQYVLGPQFQFEPRRDDYYNQNKPLQFQQQFPGFSQFDSYLPQRDLQTSHLPFHLQKTLPQYRFPSKEQFSKNDLPFHNIVFRPDHERPEQNVAPSTHRPNYSHFLSKNHQRDPSQTETFLGQITLDNSFGSLNDYYNDESKTQRPNPIPDKILRQHTRILAPDPDEKQNKLQENKYFVNENGEVFSTTTVSPPSRIFPLKRLSTKLEIAGENRNSREFPRNNIIETGQPSYPSKELDQVFNSANNFDSSDYDYEDEHIKLMMNTKDDDSSHLPSSSEDKIPEDIKVNFENKSVKITQENLTKIEEPVVSVITTKSVINNTIIATRAPPNPSTTEGIQSSSPTPENTTDSWVVVASVQTSKSISGAHYLPSSIVAQEERFTLLNEKERRDKLNEEITTTEPYSSYEDYDTESTTEEFTTQVPMKHSTESLIDKLDRVQSDLSSGLLTGGYKNEDNNIAVITENMTEKTHTAEITEPSEVASQIFPPTAKSNIPVIKKFSPHSRPPTSNLYPKRKQTYKKPTTTTTTESTVKDDTKNEVHPKIIIAKADAFLPPGYKPPVEKESSSELLAELLRKFKGTTDEDKTVETKSSSLKEINKSNKIEPSQHRFGSGNLTHVKNDSSSLENATTGIDALLKIAKPVDIKNFLPPGYKLDSTSKSHSKDEDESISDGTSTFSPPAYQSKTNKSPSSLIDKLLQNAKKDDVSSLLPPGFDTSQTINKKKVNSTDSIIKNAKLDDISAFLPPGYKPPASSPTPKKSLKIETILQSSTEDDISAFLPPGYKPPAPKNISKIDQIFQNSKEDDISAFLPPGYKSKSSSGTNRPKPKVEDIFEKSKKDDISAFLPPGYRSKSFTTRKPTSIKEQIEVENLPTSLLPSGYKPRKEINKASSTTEQSVMSSSPPSTTTAKASLKIVFPSRPGGKRVNHKLTTSRPKDEKKDSAQAPLPTIHKGWPTRATTEFTGWPTPSTTPISIEKLLESVQRAAPTTTEPENISVTTTTQTTVITSTKPPKSTTPGICERECDLVGTIRLIDGVKWVPELLDRNTKKWQLLANEVQTQLEEVYTKSNKLRQLFKSLRIDGFTNGSVLVDYLVEMNNIDMHISTSEMKNLFNEALDSTLVKSTQREGKSLNETVKYEEKSKLGKFIIDPEYTDFIVVPKQSAPTVGYAEDNLLLPQWAIAVIVIGLASLLFVIIFGVTVLVNRTKNAKKKIPTPLTDDMLNELNKNHMGGYDNYAVEDPYSMEAGFWDPRRMDAHREYNRLPKKGSSGSIHDNSMTNLYDSWKSQWNGYYNNSAGGYYSNSGPGSSHRIYERRRSYDTNF